MNSSSSDCENKVINNQNKELEVLDIAYEKVSDRLKMIHDEFNKNLDEIMKLNILKGMLTEENIRTSGSKIWVKHKQKNRTTDLNEYDNL